MSKELVKPVSILTEETLNLIEKNNFGSTFTEARGNIIALINSHRELFRANAELSFKIFEQRKIIDRQHILLEQYGDILNQVGEENE